MTHLRQQMIHEMQLRNLAERTQEAYLFAVGKLAQHYHRRPDQINEKEVRDYLLYEINERKLSWSSVNQKMNGLMFFYRHTLKQPQAEFSLPPRKVEQRLPEVLSAEELGRLFKGLRHPKYQMVFKLAYGSGLRLGEILNLKPADIDSQRMMIRVDQGKGNKDRYTVLSKKLLEELRAYWKMYRPKGWLFEGWHGKPLGGTSVQKAFIEAKKKAGITKGVSFHSLRHSFATHLLEANVDVRTIQSLMGHENIQTTMRYMQITQKRVSSTPSPLDLLGRPA
jgi:integrase/recombinase XerD